MPRWRNLMTCLAAALALAAGPAAAQEKLPVVATFSILGDLVRQVGGDRVAVTVLVGPGGDAHVYAPTPQDAKALVEAKLIVANGLGFEGWIDRLIASSGAKVPVAVASTGVAPITVPGGKHGHDHRGAADPHAWQTVANVKRYVVNIRDALGAVDPAGKAAYGEHAAAYLAALDGLEKEVREAMARIPRERRKVITSHDAFGYFAAAYGIAFVAPRGVSTESEPSAKDVAAIIRQIRREKIPAVFIETITDERLVKRIAAETGAAIGGTIYSDQLSPPDGPAATYMDMMRHNARTLAKALAPQS